MIEKVVKKKAAATERIIQYVLMAMTIFLGIIGVMTIVLLPSFLVALIVTIYYSRRLKDEYEYGYDRHTGDLEIAKVMNGAKRKVLLDVNLDQVHSVCPYAQCSELHGKGACVEDYASGSAEAAIYVIVTEGANGKHRHILFEPSDEMLAAMQERAPGKVQIG